MKKKKQNRYVVDPSFYNRLTFYILASFLLILLLLFAIITFSYISGIDLNNLPKDVCDETSKNYSYFFCYLTNSENSSFYYLFYNVNLIIIILIGLSIVILNVFYIANKFYFRWLKKEKSCGAVIYKIVDGEIYYLLLKMNHGHTSLCKGHQEGEETESETALREIKEETSLDVDLTTDFRYTITYKPAEEAIKDVVFFLATPKTDDVPIDNHDEEVSGFEWANYDDTLYKITFMSDRDTIKKAHRYIKSHRYLGKNTKI